MTDTTPRGGQAPARAEQIQGDQSHAPDTTPPDFPRPSDPRFSSGPCRKHPGWSLTALDNANSGSVLGRSHRAKQPKHRLQQAIDRSASLIGLPDDWKLGILPGSDTGAFEAAMWSLLGPRPVDALVWDAFSADWANDLAMLDLPALNTFTADYGELPDPRQANTDNDLIFVLNGTTSGVWLPDLDWIPIDRQGLVLCDATSAAFARPLEFSRLDVVTWSWQKVLGGEGAHGMLALSPRAIERLENHPAPRPLPKIFRLTKNGKLIDGIFKGATINTPSMLAVEDLHSALDWAESIGGAPALIQRTSDNFAAMDAWVSSQSWIDWLATDPVSRSHTAMCLSITDEHFAALDDDTQQQKVNQMVALLASEKIAFDIGNYRSAPAGFRIWGGPTIDTEDFNRLGPWLEWAFNQINLQEEHND